MAPTSELVIDGTYDKFTINLGETWYVGSIFILFLEVRNWKIVGHSTDLDV